MKGKGGNTGNGTILVEKRIFKPRAAEKVTVSSKPFVVLRPYEDQNPPVLEEGEVQQLDVHREEGEVNSRPQEQSGTSILEIPCAYAILQEIHNSPTGVISSPSYA